MKGTPPSLRKAAAKATLAAVVPEEELTTSMLASHNEPRTVGTAGNHPREGVFLAQSERISKYICADTGWRSP